MNSTSIGLSIIIITTFVLLFFSTMVMFRFNEIKNNWPKYKCNPAVMPFAGMFGYDAVDNFVQCSQNIQMNFMPHLLKPVYFNIGTLSNSTSSLSSSLGNFRLFLSSLRSFVGNIVGNFFTFFTSLLSIFSRIITVVSDTFNKLVAVFYIMQYILIGSFKAVESAWDGPPGQVLRFVGGICFHPDTLIKLKDNTFCKMKDLKLNSILKTGAEVCSIMKISNIRNSQQVEDIYIIKNGENNEDILVTGSHLIFDPEINNFVKVKDFKPSIKTEIKCDELCCLITSNNTIPIGKWIFHDWEDNNSSKIVV